ADPGLRQPRPRVSGGDRPGRDDRPIAAADGRLRDRRAGLLRPVRPPGRRAGHPPQRVAGPGIVPPAADARVRHDRLPQPSGPPEHRRPGEADPRPRVPRDEAPPERAGVRHPRPRGVRGVRGRRAARAVHHVPQRRPRVPAGQLPGDQVRRGGRALPE
ncbi:MAG: hypothetical protein AVDCRST_MAG64-1309, partial [uncultured Phycisphaerae bacterium]